MRLGLRQINSMKQENTSLAYKYSYNMIEPLLGFYKKHPWKQASFKWNDPRPINNLALFIKYHLDKLNKHAGKSESLSSLATLIKLKEALEMQIKGVRKRGTVGKKSKKVNNQIALE